MLAVNYFVQKLFCNFDRKLFCLKIIVLENIFAENCSVRTLFGQKIIWHKIIFTENYFAVKIFRPKIDREFFWAQITSAKNYFTRNNFRMKIVLTKNSFGKICPGNFGQKVRLSNFCQFCINLNSTRNFRIFWNNIEKTNRKITDQKISKSFFC